MIELTRYIPLPPYACWVCREKGDESTARKYFISTGTDTYDEGRVYICNVCFMEMVRCSPEVITKDYSDELLDVQSSTVAVAMKIRERWNELLAYSKEQGLDLEKFLDGRSINTDHNRASRNESEPVGEVGTSSGDNSEPESESELKLTLLRK